MPSHASRLPDYLAVLIPIAFVLFWIFISMIIAAMSGWRVLTVAFTKQSEPYGATQTAGPFFNTVYMRFRCQYSGVIRMTAADDALYLSVLGVFRAGHPPLRIPWTEIKISRTSRGWRSVVLLTLGNREGIPMRISERMARKLGIFDRTPTPPSSSQLRSWSSAPRQDSSSAVHRPPPLQ